MTILLTGKSGCFGKTLLGHRVARAGPGIAAGKVTAISRNRRNFLKQFREFRPWPCFHSSVASMAVPSWAP
jgi:hypothetical protein